MCVAAEGPRGASIRDMCFALVQREALLLDGVDLRGGGDGGVCCLSPKEKRIRGGEA